LEGNRYKLAHGQACPGILALISEFENDIQMDGIIGARGVRFGHKPLFVSEMVQLVK